MFNYLIVVKILSTISLMTVIQVMSFWRYKKESMKYQFETLLGIANSFISGLLLTSSLVYLLPESYNLHVNQYKEALNEFPWIFSVFCGAFGLISVLTQFYTYDKHFRKNIVGEYFNYEHDEKQLQDQYDVSDVYEEQSQNKKSNQFHHNLHIKKQTSNQYSSQIHNTKDSYLTNKFSYSIGTPMNGTIKGVHEDDHHHLQIPFQLNDCQENKYQYSNYKPQYLYLIYSIHSFFECSAIGLQKETLSTIMICLSIFLHKWFEVLFIQMQTKFSICKSQSQNYIVIFIYTLCNVSGLGFGWIAQAFFSNIQQAVFLSISGGTFFAIAINDLLHAEINKGNKYRFLKILLFITSIILINLAWYAQKQIHESDTSFQ